VVTGIQDINALIGSLIFNNNLFTGSSVGDLLLGLPQQLTLTSNSVFNQSQRLHFLYIQDDFKLSQKLTCVRTENMILGPNKLCLPESTSWMIPRIMKLKQRNVQKLADGTLEDAGDTNKRI
jgi:hypothetical protein